MRSFRFIKTFLITLAKLFLCKKIRFVLGLIFLMAIFPACDGGDDDFDFDIDKSKKSKKYKYKRRR